MTMGFARLNFILRSKFLLYYLKYRHYVTLDIYISAVSTRPNFGVIILGRDVTSQARAIFVVFVFLFIKKAHSLRMHNNEFEAK